MKLKILTQFSIGSHTYAPYRTDIHGDGKLAPKFVDIEPEEVAAYCISQRWAEPAVEEKVSAPKITETKTETATGGSK